MPTVEFSGDDSAALEYIRKRGYASYSSIKNVRDKEVPMRSSAKWFDIGTEVHARLLENKVTELTNDEDELMVRLMLRSLKDNAIVRRLLEGSNNEDKFHQDLWGLSVLGYIDINNKKQRAIGDLKTTRLTKLHQFIGAMDFLQAAMYRAVTGFDDFYYIGISKVKPYDVMVFNVLQHKQRIKDADDELKRLIKYIKGKL